MGGTGSNTAAGARTNLALDRITQKTDGAFETQMASGDKTKFIYVNNGGGWGCYDNITAKFIPLSVEKGGTRCYNGSRCTY